MSEGKNISSVPVVTDVSHLLGVTSGGSVGRIGRGRFQQYTNISPSLPAGTDIELTDFLNQYIVGGNVGTLISENEFSDARRRRLKIGGSYYSLQKYCVLILRSVRDTLAVDWGNWCFALIPARGGRMLFVNAYTGELRTQYYYEVCDAVGNVVVAKTIAPIVGGGKRFAFNVLRIAEGRMVA